MSRKPLSWQSLFNCCPLPLAHTWLISAASCPKFRCPCPRASNSPRLKANWTNSKSKKLTKKSNNWLSRKIKLQQIQYNNHPIGIGSERSKLDDLSRSNLLCVPRALDDGSIVSWQLQRLKHIQISPWRCNLKGTQYLVMARLVIPIHSDISTANSSTNYAPKKEGA